MALPDQSAVVFGASGGIGRALVQQLVNSGRFAIVYAGSRNPLTTLPASAESFRFDLTDEQSICAAANAFALAPTLVIVATGVLHDPALGISPEKSWRALDPDSMARVIAINTIGPALIAKHMLPRLPRDQRAIFAALSARVGSISDNRLGGWHAYRASKAALNMLIANFGIELARSHRQAITAALHPGTVASALSAPFRQSKPDNPLFTPSV